MSANHIIHSSAHPHGDSNSFLHPSFNYSPPPQQPNHNGNNVILNPFVTGPHANVPNNPHHHNIEHYDVVIVGGGVSGAFCAARLAEYFPKYSILLLDKNPTIGGRLQSLPIPLYKQEKLCAEMGGMRYFPDIDVFTSAALDYVNLRGKAVPESGDNNIAYLRRHRTTFANLPSDAAQIYNLSPSEEGKTSSDLIDDAINNEALDLHLANKEELSEGSAVVIRRSFKSPQPITTNFWRMCLNQGMTEEAFQYYVDSSGYMFSMGDISMAAGVREDYSLTGNFQQEWVEGGYQQLPVMLVEMAKRMCPKFKVLTNVSVEGFRPHVGGSVGSQAVTVQIGGAWNVVTDKLILSCPRNDLMNLKAPWTPKALQLFDAVTPWRAVKIWLEFQDGDFMRGLEGKNVTDLPASQVWFPFGTRTPVALIYADEFRSDFWRDLIPPDGSFPPFRWHPSHAVPRLVDEAVRQIGRVIGASISTTNVVQVAYSKWDYGTVFWKAQHEASLGSVSDMRDLSLAPLGENVPVHLVGDSFSFSQGWVDGALETGDLLLTRIFGIPSILKNRRYKKPVLVKKSTSAQQQQPQQQNQLQKPHHHHRRYNNDHLYSNLLQEETGTSAPTISVPHRKGSFYTVPYDKKGNSEKKKKRSHHQHAKNKHTDIDSTDNTSGSDSNSGSSGNDSDGSVSRDSFL